MVLWTGDRGVLPSLHLLFAVGLFAFGQWQGPQALALVFKILTEVLLPAFLREAQDF